MAKTTAEKIAVMRAYLDGKPIEVQSASATVFLPWTLWKSKLEPNWDWGTVNYRVEKTPHKHAAVIHAYADGAEIECRDEPDSAWYGVSTPCFHPNKEYRVKSD